MFPYLLVLSLPTSCLGSETHTQTKASRPISGPGNRRQFQKGSDQDIWDFAMSFTTLQRVHPSGKCVMVAEKNYRSLSLGVVEVVCPLPSHIQKCEHSQRNQGDSR